MSKKQMMIVTAIGVIALIAGAIGWIMQLSSGLIANSGMTNIFLWGLMIAMFAFFVGFGAGAQIVATAIYVWGRLEWRPFAHLAAAIGLACVCAAGVAILADLGAIRNVLAMLTSLNLRSPLAWDMIAITLFIVLSVVQLFALARGLKYEKVWVIAAGIAAVILQIVEGLLFSTQTAHPWWATPIMPIDFLVVAFVSGSALILLIACVKSCKNCETKVADIIESMHAAVGLTSSDTEHLANASSTSTGSTTGPRDMSASACAKGKITLTNWLAKLCAIAIVVHLVFMMIDVVLIAFNSNNPVDGGIVGVLQAYMPLYATEIILPLIAAGIFFVFDKSKSTSKPGLISGCILVFIGIFAHRMMLLYPAYNAPSLYLTLSGTNDVTGAYPVAIGRYLETAQSFALSTPYIPAPTEWLAALLPLGVAIVATIVILQLLNALSKK